MPAEKLVIDQEPNAAFLENKRMSLDAGTLGKFFGTGSMAPTNIAGFVLVLLLVGGMLAMFIETKMPAADYWKLAAPIITGALGFIFGSTTRR